MIQYKKATKGEVTSMLAIQLIKISWSKNSRDLQSTEKRKALFFPSMIEWNNQQGSKDIFLSNREFFYLSDREMDFWHDYYKKQNFYRRNKKNETCNSKIISFTPKIYQKMTNPKTIWTGNFYSIDEINKNTISYIRIVQEDNGYRVKWFNQTGLFTQPFRKGGNEDSYNPRSELYLQLNTLNETAFVLSDGQAGEIRYNFRLVDQDEGVHTYTEYRIYMVNTNRLTNDVFIRDYNYLYKQLAKLY